MNLKTTTASLLCGAVFAISSAQAVVIASFADGTDNSRANKVSVTGISTSTLQQSGIQTGTIGDLFIDNANDLANVATNIPTPAGPNAGSGTGSNWVGTFTPALPGGFPNDFADYIGFTVNADAGFEFDLNSISYDVSALNASPDNDPFTFNTRVFASIDGGATFIEVGAIDEHVQDGSAGFSPVSTVNRTFGPLAPQFEGITSVEIRIGFKADEGLGRTDIAVNDDQKAVILQGLQLDATVRDLNAIPEPSSAALLALGALGFLVGRRRR